MVALPAAWTNSPEVKLGLVLVVFTVTAVAIRAAGPPVPGPPPVLSRPTAMGRLLPARGMTETPGSSVTLMGV
jgi:hypothetical protein